MPTYATQQTFGGQHASLGRSVLLMWQAGASGGGLLRTGIITRIDVSADLPVFWDVLAQGELDVSAWTYTDVVTASDALAMAPGSWAWPPPAT